MLVLLTKFSEFRAALQSGDWKRAAKLVAEIINILVPSEEGAPPMFAERCTEEQCRQFDEDCAAVESALQNPPAAGPGLAIAIALLTKFGPILIELLKDRIKR